MEVWRLKAEGCSVNDIAAALNRTASGVYKVLARGHQVMPKHRSGRPKCTSERTDRRIVQLAATGEGSVRAIAACSAVQASKSTIHRRLQNNYYLVYTKFQKTLPLTAVHKHARVEWARQHMTWDDKWLTDIFSDEKKWNLDGPDGNQCYWHDLRHEPRTILTRQHGGGSVMVWGGFGFNGVTDLAFVTGRQTSAKYQETLAKHLLPCARDIGGPDWIFQQDNAPILTSQCTKAWFGRENINILEWPSCSPDLNPIENVWGVMMRRVYANGKQYMLVDGLQSAIVDCWFTLETELLPKLVMDMKERVFEVIESNGKRINK